VLGLHPHPFRFVSYMASADAALAGMEGLANFAWAVPGAGFDEDDVRRDLFGVPHVVSAQPSRTIVTAFQELLDEFVVLIRIVEGIILLLAVLVAFNSASINADERRREHATMFAFGVPVRTAMLGAVAENALLGLGATLAGIVAGWLVLRWMVDYLLADTMPDLDLPSALEPMTVLIALVLGVLAVALAPLLTYRKVRNMDIASTLKFTE
jgi:putative ABC transport system permease protein